MDEFTSADTPGFSEQQCDLGEGYGWTVDRNTDVDPGEPHDISLELVEPGGGAGVWMPPAEARALAAALLDAADEAERAI